MTDSPPIADSPLNRLLGVEIVSCDPETGHVKCTFNISEDLNNLQGIIHGGIPIALRKELLETQGEYDFVVIQIYAGGTGLNLQRFNTVIINSPHWNPFIEEQAIARVHRIGQSQNVNIYHLVETKTIDAHIIEVQDCKKQVWEEVSNNPIEIM